MDVLDYFLDDDSPGVTAKPTQKVLPAKEASDELDLLMEEFTASSDNASKKDALLAMLRLTGRK